MTPGSTRTDIEDTVAHAARLAESALADADGADFRTRWKGLAARGVWDAPAPDSGAAGSDR